MTRYFLERQIRSKRILITNNMPQSQDSNHIIDKYKERVPGVLNIHYDARLGMCHVAAKYF